MHTQIVGNAIYMYVFPFSAAFLVHFVNFLIFRQTFCLLKIFILHCTSFYLAFIFSFGLYFDIS